MYLRARKAVMVGGMSIREASRVFGLHRDTVCKMTAYSVLPGYRRQNPPRGSSRSPSQASSAGHWSRTWTFSGNSACELRRFLRFALLWMYAGRPCVARSKRTGQTAVIGNRC